MKIREMMVGPDLAVKWLEGNTHNRALRDSVVQRYARDMKAGRWLLTHQAIAFNDKDVLIDGQHRLWAIMESKVSVPCLVAWGVEDEAQAVIDAGLVRSDLDKIKLGHHYEGATNLHIAIVKRLAKGMVRGSLTTAEVLLLLKTHQEAIDFTVDAFIRRVRGITVAPVMAVVTRAWYTQDKVRLAEFCRRLCEGDVASADSTQPILILRNWLLERPTYKKSGVHGPLISMDDVVYGKTSRALLAFLQTETLSTLYASSTELFPLPADKLEIGKQLIRRRPQPIRRKGAA